ncbi:MAG: AgmX/PglI C-terminal domain-containing protein [Archangium sp.]|nr:AgmX/PglI C-terminal domain-containing protein [Archangium sp.]MDP3573720.1 AgmX/PglI C-terminal domain-containing protein [Archangium sp.]
MRWRVLGPVLGVILLGAIVFSMWPSAPVVVAAPETDPPVVVAAAPAPRAAVPSNAVPVVAASAPVTPKAIAPAPSGTAEVGQLDPEPDPFQLQALGLGPEDIEPLDGGVLHELTRDGIKGAITAELPQIRECYGGWLQQNPKLSGKMKVQFTIAEIPGRDRAKVMRVEIADGGMGHVAMEGCVRNVVKAIRFEKPAGGETRVTYPLSFEAPEDSL